ncbi:O-antigen ligase family protein [Colwellia sp. 6M3]|uniref:O-antigen ligase family protein n=1 Tax=Colwellia sp. 6M3 TaxID=2759849 RepID=UPI0015F6B9AD|nr:O-antigen ligase family protein [Colwellia sp. 6M3]MBA6417204.1 O-antigen ligase family protein [Colwellia sp. 6M3]
MAYFVLIFTLVVYIIRPAEWIPALYFNWNITALTFGVLVLIFSSMNQVKKSPFDRTTMYLVWFFVAMVMSNVFRFQFQTITEYLPVMLTNLIVFSLVQVAITNIEQIRRLIFTIILLLLFISYQCYLQVTLGENWGGQEPFYRSTLTVSEGVVTKIFEPQVKWFGVLSDPNDLGMILVAFIPYIFNRIVYQKINFANKLMWGTALIVLLYTIILTNSRGSILALLVAVGAFFIIKKRSMAGVVFAVLAGVVLLTFGPSRMSEIGSGDNSAMGRVYAWILSLELFAMNPILGVGADHFLDYHGRTAHNSYVLAFVETGFLGFMSYLSIFVLSISSALKVAFRTENSKVMIEIIALTAGLIGILVSIFFISRTYVLLPFFYAAVLTTYTRIQCPELFKEHIQAIKTPVLALSAVLFIVFVYIFNRLSTMFLL